MPRQSPLRGSAGCLHRFTGEGNGKRQEADVQNIHTCAVLVWLWHDPYASSHSSLRPIENDEGSTSLCDHPHRDDFIFHRYFHLAISEVISHDNALEKCMHLLIVCLMIVNLPLLANAAPDGHSDSIKRAETLAKQVTITRDAYGVPHVHATTDAGAVFGGIYARAEDEMARIEGAHARRIGHNARLDGIFGLAADRSS